MSISSISKQVLSWLPTVIGIAEQAGDAILEIYQCDFEVAEKSDNSPLTAADLAAHHCIAKGLQQLAPDIPLLSEESASISYDIRSNWITYWLVDPLDGTREFVKRNGEFTVNIALIHDQQPILGVIHVPVTGVCYAACKESNAYRYEHGKDRVAIQVTRQAAHPLRVVGSRSHRTPEMTDYLRALGAHTLQSRGSSLKFCLVAEGLADLYPRLGPTSEWDTAAAQCIVEAAGGHVVTGNGQPLRYNTRSSLLNPFFWVYGDDSRDWSLRDG